MGIKNKSHAHKFLLPVSDDSLKEDDQELVGDACVHNLWYLHLGSVKNQIKILDQRKSNINHVRTLPRLFLTPL